MVSAIQTALMLAGVFFIIKEVMEYIIDKDIQRRWGEKEQTGIVPHGYNLTYRSDENDQSNDR